MILSALSDWRAIPDLAEAAGVGTYRTTVTLEPGWDDGVHAVLLDLGRIAGSMQVEVNGQLVAEFMASQPGFIQYTLSRHIDADKQNRYVNVALWTDVNSWRKAIAHPGFQVHAEEIRARCTNEANMYAPRQAYSVK